MTTFRHIIGQSTLTEGIAVPKELEDWIRAPNAGEKREINLLFDEGQIKATLRRIANSRGNVQIKYENRAGFAFRNWMRIVFIATQAGAVGEYLELTRVDGDTFRVTAFPLNVQPAKRLVVTEWICLKTSERILDTHAPVREIPAVVQSVEFNADEGQHFYNRQLFKYFKEWNWDAEKRVIPNLPLKSDFIKSGVQVEVEFGNARTYYQDYIKFLLAHNQEVASVGVLIVPTESFARTLCAVGRKKAEAKGRHSYSGMIHLEKVRRELDYLAFMLKMPLAIAGIGPDK